MMPQTIGCYEIANELERGEWGVVYRGRDPRTGRTVAVKRVLLDMPEAQQSAFRARFVREAEAAARLNHPGIVPIFDVGEEDNAVYAVMEYVAGQTLRKLIDQQRHLTPPHLIDIARQVAALLAHAHEHAIQHPALRPSNIVFGAGGRVRITDFGVARPIAMLHPSQSGVHYQPPERILVKRLDRRGDVFSLGVIMYEMALGRTPFGSDANLEPRKLMRLIVTTNAPALRSANSAVPAGLDAVIMKAIARDPAARHADMAALALDLAKLDETATPAVPAKPAGRRTAAPTPTRPAAAAPPAAAPPAPLKSAAMPGAADSSEPTSSSQKDFEENLLADIEAFSRDMEGRLAAQIESEQKPAGGSKSAGARPERNVEADSAAKVASAAPDPRPVDRSPADAEQVPENLTTTSNLLARLADEAQRIQKAEQERQSDNVLRMTDEVRLVETKMRQTYTYLNELMRQLDVIRPAIPRTYSLLGIATFDDLVWAGGSVDYRLVEGRPASSELVDYINVAYTLRSDKTHSIEREGPQVEKLRRLLFDLSIKFQCEEYKNSRARVERARFTLNNEVRVTIVLKALHREGAILISGKNMERFSATEFCVKSRKVEAPMLDEFGKLLLGQPHKFFSMGQLITLSGPSSVF